MQCRRQANGSFIPSVCGRQYSAVTGARPPPATSPPLVHLAAAVTAMLTRRRGCVVRTLCDTGPRVTSPGCSLCGDLTFRGTIIPQGLIYQRAGWRSRHRRPQKIPRNVAVSSTTSSPCCCLTRSCLSCPGLSPDHYWTVARLSTASSALQDDVDVQNDDDDDREQRVRVGTPHCQCSYYCCCCCCCSATAVNCH